MPAPAQPYPHVLRKRGDASNCEERQLELAGTTVITRRWQYGGGWTRRTVKETRTRHTSARAARAALDAAVATLRAAGWDALPDWPHTPPDWFDRSKLPAPPKPTAATPAPAAKPLPRPRPIAVARVRSTGRARPVSATRLAAVERALATTTPPSWRALLGRLGAGTFAGRLRLATPEAVVRDTRRWRRGYRDEYRTVFANHDEALGERARELVLLGSSIEGDRVAFVAGAPGRVLILPRDRDHVVITRGLPEVLGWYARIARDVDDADPTYTPAA